MKKIKKKMISHMLINNPGCTPCVDFLTFEGGFIKIHYKGKYQWSLWFNDAKGSTHMVLESDIKEEDDEYKGTS